MKLKSLEDFSSLNTEEKKFITGGVNFSSSTSDNTDVDTVSNDSYSDDNSKSTDSKVRDTITVGH